MSAVDVAAEPAHQIRIIVHSLETARAIHPPATGYGDIKLSWEADDSEEANAARMAFERAIKPARDGGYGFRAWRMDKSGKRGEELLAWDARAERVLLTPPQVGG